MSVCDINKPRYPRDNFFQKSSIFIEHSGQVWYNYNSHRNGRFSGEPRQTDGGQAARYSGEPPVLSTVEGHVLVSADTRQKPSFVGFLTFAPWAGRDRDKYNPRNKLRG